MSNLGNLDPGARVVLFPLWIDVLPGDEGERVNNHFVSSWGKPVAIKIGHVFDFVDVPNKVVNDCWTQLNRTDCGTNSTRSSNENERSVSIVCKWTTTPVSGCHVDLSNSGMLTLAPNGSTCISPYLRQQPNLWTRTHFHENTKMWSNGWQGTQKTTQRRWNNNTFNLILSKIEFFKFF